MTPAQSQEYQRLSNEIIALTGRIQQIKTSISVAARPLPSTNQAPNSGDSFNQSKLMVAWRVCI